MSVFGFCNNKCKHEVYTKKETDNKAIVVSPTEPTTGEKVWLKKGKNLIKNFYYNEFFDISIGSMVNGGDSFARTGFIEVETDTWYVFSHQLGSNGGSIICFDENKSYIAEIHHDNITAPFKVPEKTKYIMINVWTQSGIRENETWVQFEQNTQATPYEEYIEPTIFVKNQNGVYEKMYLKDEGDTVLKETVQGYNENSKINIEMTFRRSGNVVTVVGSLKINENEGNADGMDLIRFTNDTSLIETNNAFGYIKIPDFAKTNESSDDNICLVHVNGNTDNSTTNLGIYNESFKDVMVVTRVFGCYFFLQKMKNYSDRYMLQGTLGFTPEVGCTYNFSFSYIVE